MSIKKHTIQELYQWQGLPLSIKIRMTIERIRNWVNEYGEDGVYVSFSGGKDSTVLLDIVRNWLGYKHIPAVFVDVPTQYPELKAFATSFENVTVLKPRISFMEVCQKYGFPLISKEVSEKAMYARKYLQKYLEQHTISQTGRQADRQTGRQADRDSICVCNSGYARNRQTKQIESGKNSANQKGDYP